MKLKDILATIAHLEIATATERDMGMKGFRDDFVSRLPPREEQALVEHYQCVKAATYDLILEQFDRNTPKEDAK